MTQVTVDKLIDQLDLHGVLMMQGMLVNRGLKILHEQEEAKVKKESGQLLLPENGLIVPK